mmetsp:Transcript_3932/g.3861  ORF Transcript_3932/g.3861 Transcript_3932/m.3861 type:complete len:229 (-) Transcript_3932:170-856(-)
MCFYFGYILVYKVVYLRNKLNLTQLITAFVKEGCMIFFFFFKWVVTYIFLNNDNVLEIIESTDYQELHKSAYWYQQIYILDSILLVFIFVGLLSALRLSRYMHWVFSSLDKALVLVVALMVVIIPTITGYTYFAYIVFGTQIEEYSSFGNAMTAVLLQSLGSQNTEAIYRQNFVIAVIWLCSYWIFIYFFLSTSFMAIFIFSYENTVKEQGYPNDFLELAKWEYKNYF